jgi:putative transcriptional regulator
MSKLLKGLKAGLKEAIAHDKGKLDLHAELMKIPAPPEHYKAKDIKRIREKKSYSQSVFAKVLNVSIKTVQSWESGQRAPSQAALRLLEIVDKGIYHPPIHKKH